MICCLKTVSPTLRSLFAPLCLVAASVVLVACGSTPELEPMELPDFETRAKLERIWSTGIGSGQDVRYTLLVPAVEGDVIYASDVEGEVRALNRLTGEEIWEVNLDEPVSGGVGVGDGLLLLGTYNAEIIALSTEDGSERWRRQVSSEVLSPPQTNGRTVVVQSFDGVLTALDHETGEERWNYESTMPLLTVRGSSTPLVVGPTVYTGFANGKVLALQTDDGLLIWEQRVAIPQGRSELERMVDVDASPLLVGNILFVVSYQGDLMALSRATGRPLWAQPASSLNDLSAGLGKVYLTNVESGIKAYDINSGQLAWENEQLLRRKLTAPAAFQRYLAVGDEEGGYLHLLSQSDGEIVARRRIDRAGLRSPMLVVGDVLYVYSNDGKLAAFRVSARNEEN